MPAWYECTFTSTRCIVDKKFPSCAFGAREVWTPEAGPFGNQLLVGGPFGGGGGGAGVVHVQASAVPRKNFLCCGMLRHAAACCGMLLPAHVGTYTSMGADRQGRQADVVPNTFPMHQKSEDLCNNREELTGNTLSFPGMEPRTFQNGDCYIDH